MSLDDIHTGTVVFIDANIFIYHFTAVSGECSNLLTRCERGDLSGITSVNVILEVLHRLMMIEAVRKNIVDAPNVVRKLKKYPEKTRLLNEYFTNTRKIKDMDITIRPLDNEIIQKSHAVRTTYGLMVNDSIIVSIMQDAGINVLATNNRGFEEIDNITVYAPDDVELIY